MKISEAPDDRLIAGYVRLRDLRAQRKKRYENEDENDRKHMYAIEVELLRRLNERGTDSTSARGVGTAYRYIKPSCTVADWDSFFKFVRENNAWEFLTHAASKEAVAAFREETDDLPPGLNWSETVAIGFRRS